MISNQEDTNLTQYEKVWVKMRQELNIKASEYVPQMYDALRQDKYSPEEAREKIKKDSINIWKKETIDKFIPVEAKQEIKVLAGQKGAETKANLLESQSSTIHNKNLEHSSIHKEDEEPELVSLPKETKQYLIIKAGKESADFKMNVAMLQMAEVKKRGIAIDMETKKVMYRDEV